MSGTDRKTVRRYVEMARSCGVDRDGGACRLSDELLAAVIAGVRRTRPNGKEPGVRDRRRAGRADQGVAG